MLTRTAAQHTLLAADYAYDGRCSDSTSYRRLNILDTMTGCCWFRSSGHNCSRVALWTNLYYTTAHTPPLIPDLPFRILPFWHFATGAPSFLPAIYLTARRRNRACTLYDTNIVPVERRVRLPYPHHFGAAAFRGLTARAGAALLTPACPFPTIHRCYVSFTARILLPGRRDAHLERVLTTLPCRLQFPPTFRTCNAVELFVQLSLGWPIRLVITFVIHSALPSP